MNPGPRLFTLRQKRLLVGRKAAMTIAIGMACHKGVIVAADTQIAIGVAAQKASKVYLFKGKSGAFAVAFASEDTNATRTLIHRIERKLDTTECANSVELEGLVCTEMTNWRAAYSKTVPSMQLVLSSRLINDGARLYFCEPPNTFLQEYNYVAAGIGADVTDSLNTMLFGFGHEHTEVQAALRRVSYLMYRAKKDNVFCGKSTYCGIISWNCETPIVVNHLDFEKAEHEACELDFLLHTVAQFYLGGAEDKLEENANGISDMFKMLTTFRVTEFHDIYGELIKL